MIEKKTTPDTRDFETKVFKAFTKRQLICIVIGLCLGFFTYTLVGIDNITVRIIIAMVPASLAFLFGFMESPCPGMTFEQYVMHVIRFTIQTKDRIYITEGSEWNIVKDEENNEDTWQRPTPSTKYTAIKC